MCFSSAWWKALYCSQLRPGTFWFTSDVYSMVVPMRRTGRNIQLIKHIIYFPSHSQRAKTAVITIKIINCLVFETDNW